MERVDLKTADRAGSTPAGVTELAVTADRTERVAAVVEAVLGSHAIAVPFAKFNDGRGFSIARLLRSDHGFRGEIIAVGHVIPDQALHLLRAGFDSVVLNDPARLPSWQKSLASYKGAYQTAARNPLALRREASRRNAREKDAALLAQKLSSTNDLTERIRMIAAATPGRLAFSTSLGKEDQAILHAIHDAGADVDVFTLDTLRHFPETLETLKKSQEHFGIEIRVVTPDEIDLQELIARDGEFGFRTSVESRKACCMIRKVLPLNRALKGASGWITGLRRGQSAERTAVPLASWEAEYDLQKVSPLADWTAERLETYIDTHAIPVNPLHAQGYPSIGCEPCTRAVRPGEDERAGRWWWENEDGKECGLHVRRRDLEAA